MPEQVRGWVHQNRRALIFWALMLQAVAPTGWAIYREIQTMKHEWFWEIDWVFIARTHWPALLAAASSRFAALWALDYVPADVKEIVSEFRGAESGQRFPGDNPNP